MGGFVGIRHPFGPVDTSGSRANRASSPLGSRTYAQPGHDSHMTAQTREEAEAALAVVAQEYGEALAALQTAERNAEQAVFRAKDAGLSQHDIARIMGEPWTREHNPQFPPVLDLQKPRPASDGDQ